MEDLAQIVTWTLFIGWGLGLVAVLLALLAKFGKVKPRLAWYPTAFTLSASIYFFFAANDRLGLILGALPLVAFIILVWKKKA